MQKIMYMKLPLHIELPRKTKPSKKIYLNMNTYRNLHFQLMNQAKVEFARLVHPMLEQWKRDHGIADTHYIMLEFIYFNGTRRLSDLANHCVIVDKFFSDCLVTE